MCAHNITWDPKHFKCTYSLTYLTDGVPSHQAQETTLILIIVQQWSGPKMESFLYFLPHYLGITLFILSAQTCAPCVNLATIRENAHIVQYRSELWQFLSELILILAVSPPRASTHRALRCPRAPLPESPPVQDHVMRCTDRSYNLDPVSLVSKTPHLSWFL